MRHCEAYFGSVTSAHTRGDGHVYESRWTLKNNTIAKKSMRPVHGSMAGKIDKIETDYNLLSHVINQVTCRDYCFSLLQYASGIVTDFLKILTS